MSFTRNVACPREPVVARFQLRRARLDPARLVVQVEVREVPLDGRLGVGDDDVAACLRDGVRPVVAHLVRGERRIAPRQRHPAPRDERIRLALVGERLGVDRHLAWTGLALPLRPHDVRPAARRHAGDTERPGAASELDGDVADARRARHAVGDGLADEDRHGRAVGLGEEPDGAHHGVVDIDRRRARHAVVAEEDGQLAGEGLARAGRAARADGRLRPRRPVLDARLGLGTYGHRRRRLRPRARQHPDLRGRRLGRAGKQRAPEGEATRPPSRPPGPHGRGSVAPAPGACQASKSAWPPPMSS